MAKRMNREVDFGGGEEDRYSDKNLRTRLLYFMALDTYNHHQVQTWRNTESRRMEMWEPTSKPSQKHVGVMVDEYNMVDEYKKRGER